MSVISSIEPQQHDPERVNVYLDGEFGFGAFRALVLLHDLHEGMDLGSEQVELLRHDDSVERAHSAALNLLSFRPRSRHEVVSYLRKKKTEPEIVSAVVERLERAALLDDTQFATYWVDNRVNFRPRGARALRSEMRTKGLDAEVIDDALAALGDEGELAYKAGQKKAGGLAKFTELEFIRKMVAFLQRRGFSYSLSFQAAQRLWIQTGASLERTDGFPTEDVDE